MSAGKSNDQLYIGDDGELVSQPLTWDGEPLYSPATVREGLFDSAPFAQMDGQTAMDTDAVAWKQDDSLVFDQGDGPESAQWAGDTGLGNTRVYRWRDGREMFVPTSCIRLETSEELHARTVLGYYVEQL